MDSTLRRAAIFEGLPHAAVKALNRCLSNVKFSRGQVIFREGEPGETLYIVIEGRVRISRRSPAGDDAATAMLGPPDIFGEVAVFDPGPRTATASAVTDVKAAALHRTALRTWIREHPATVGALLAMLARRQRRAAAQTCDLLTCGGLRPR